MTDNERARLRAIMYEPSSVWLATDSTGVRWLTDQYVLYDVTNAEVISEVPDGAYQLMASGEWRAEARDSVPPPDVSAYLEIVSVSVWSAAQPTEWSVAEHPGKAMLWSAQAGDWAAGGWHPEWGDRPLTETEAAALNGRARPCLLGEPTWSAIKRHHPNVQVDWAPNKGAGTFRFSEAYHLDPEETCAEGDCDCPEVVFAYAAGIRVPEGQEHVAAAIVSVAGGGSYSPIITGEVSSAPLVLRSTREAA